jgi:hypothetical protein
VLVTAIVETRRHEWRAVTGFLTLDNRFYQE